MYRYDCGVNVDPGKTITIKYDFGCITIISDSGTIKYNIQSSMYQYELVIEKGNNVINSIYHGEECEVLIDSNDSINLTVNLATA